MTDSALFQRGDFTLASGAKSGWKIECDALTAEDWATLAVMLVEVLPHQFCGVYGVPRGGIPLMKALVPHQVVGAAWSLVVDDVWTTGGSMQRFIDADVQRLDTRNLMRAVIFARNPVPSGVTALFAMVAKPTIRLSDMYGWLRHKPHCERATALPEEPGCTCGLRSFVASTGGSNGSS